MAFINPISAPFIANDVLDTVKKTKTAVKTANNVKPELPMSVENDAVNKKFKDLKHVAEEFTKNEEKLAGLKDSFDKSKYNNENLWKNRKPSKIKNLIKDIRRKIKRTSAKAELKDMGIWSDLETKGLSGNKAKALLKSAPIMAALLAPSIGITLGMKKLEKNKAKKMHDPDSENKVLPYAMGLALGAPTLMSVFGNRSFLAPARTIRKALKSIPKKYLDRVVSKNQSGKTIVNLKDTLKKQSEHIKNENNKYKINNIAKNISKK